MRDVSLLRIEALKNDANDNGSVGLTGIELAASRGEAEARVTLMEIDEAIADAAIEPGNVPAWVHGQREPLGGWASRPETLAKSATC